MVITSGRFVMGRARNRGAKGGPEGTSRRCAADPQSDGKTSVHEFYAQALHLLNAVWHRRWAALGAAWLVALLGWALVVSQPNTYTSSARIFIDATSIMKAPARRPRDRLGHQSRSRGDEADAHHAPIWSGSPA